MYYLFLLFLSYILLYNKHKSAYLKVFKTTMLLIANCAFPYFIHQCLNKFSFTSNIYLILNKTKYSISVIKEITEHVFVFSLFHL
jgi:hypothetical protein